MDTYSKDEARSHIAALVADFQKNEAALKDVAEAQIENNYLRPLFRYLNWNVDNAGLAEPQWEFVLQRTERGGKRPDYVLRLEGQDLLVMDAKKVKYDMHDPRWVNQVYAYAYSTQNNPPSKKIDFAILTDFQEFVVLDCTLYAARPEAANNFRVLDWRCTDYVEQFDTLWELFERNNLLAASRERQSRLWARYLSPKKVKANRIPPDKAFLAALDDEKIGWRVRLAKDMKKLNTGLDGEVITAAVQLLIDRLIFVKALSDREIEDDYLAQMAEIVEQDGLADDDRGWFAACRSIFAKLNQIYNGSVFAPRPELEAVEVSNKTVRDVIRDLLPENSPYNFAVLPVEILGTIYERFLGRVVRATDSRVKIEDKPEVRKAGGVYYTPQYIVNYIVENTVGTLLAACQTPADVARLKILDPACGSGSFLLGAYEALIRWHEQYYREKRLTHRDREAAYYNSDNGVRLTAKLKRQILLNNLYGVDIDPQAVEVTRFSLSLKALEDTRRDELYEEVNLFKQTILPDLSENIKCGNSLIGTDFFASQMFADADEAKRVNAFDWEREFPQVFGAAPHPRPLSLAGRGESPHAPPPLPTGERDAVRGVSGGFDAVIGNPPYVFTRNEGIEEQQKVYFYERFKYQSSQLNTFGLFLEKCYGLLRQGGKFGFITPNNWLTIDTFSSLRRFVLGSTKEIRIVNILDRVFAAANVDTTIVCFEKGNPTSLTISEMKGGIEEFSQTVSLTEIKPPSYIIQISLLKDPLGQQLLRKIESASQPLGEFCTVSTGLKAYQTGKGKPPQTEREKASRVFHATSKRSKTYGKYLDGVDVSRYFLGWSGEYLSYGNWLAEPRKSVPFDGERLLVRQIPSKPPYLVHGVYTNEPFYNDINSMIAFAPIGGISLKYLLGLINSRLLSIWFQKTFDKLQRKIFPQFKVKELALFPTRRITFSDPADKARHDRMMQLVERMLALHKQRATAKIEHAQTALQRQIDATDREIDRLVYELYGLTEEEVRVVEGGSG